jgi:hypothetical protein
MTDSVLVDSAAVLYCRECTKFGRTCTLEPHSPCGLRDTWFRLTRKVTP